VGVVFSAALAIGNMTTSGEDLIEALFGRAGPLSRAEAIFGLSAAAAVIAVMLRERNRLIISVVSPDIARTVGINIRRLNFLYLEVFALTVALGLRYLGVLLMGSLVIIPAATAKRLSRNLGQMLIIAVTISSAVTLAGAMLAPTLNREMGPIIVTLAAGVFVLSLTRAQR
jgi:ABC-type Mn2+/Zn2+ transport system permease subunit